MKPEIIELGEDWTDPDPDTGPRRPARYLRPVALAVALLFTGALGAATPVTPMLTQLAVPALGDAGDMRIDNVELVNDLLLVRGDGALSAYDLDDGSLRWRLPHAAGRQRNLVAVPQVPDVVVVADDLEDGGVYVAAVDPHTGAVRWSTRNDVWVVGAYALESPVSTVSRDEASPTPPDPMQLTVRDLRTGRERWVLRGTPFAAADESRLEAWTVSPQGEFTVSDLSDGRVLRTGAVAFPPGVPQFATVYGGMLVLSARLPGGEFLETRYDTRTMRVVAATSSPLRFGCGDYLCEVGDDGGVRTPLAVLDRDTLQVRYRFEPGVHLIPSAQGAITVRADGSAQLGVPADRLIDLADGRTLLDLTGWAVQLAFDESRQALLTRSTPEGVQLARIEDGQVRLLGTLPPVQRCFHTRQRIACVYDGNRLGVWSIAATAS
ncbi:outer membrane protein assembly factor BamB family protein [Catellatospora paridis]|uniref:outer membrane protein assembly factor BamB family protein n=1 Tax=Catellatospora paridis TaxID=1617086 RepID=UPI0018AFF17A|nr:PQQ-binding-like beta-propeller repeat protein [Catellatospora paridis]